MFCIANVSSLSTMFFLSVGHHQHELYLMAFQKKMLYFVVDFSTNEIFLRPCFLNYSFLEDVSQKRILLITHDFAEIFRVFFYDKLHFVLLAQSLLSTAVFLILLGQGISAKFFYMFTFQSIVFFWTLLRLVSMPLPHRAMLKNKGSRSKMETPRIFKFFGSSEIRYGLILF